MIKTAVPDKGGKEHIIIEENNKYGWATTVCGLDTIEPPFTEYEEDEDIKDNENVCQNCRNRLWKHRLKDEIKIEQ